MDKSGGMNATSKEWERDVALPEGDREVTGARPVCAEEVMELRPRTGWPSLDLGEVWAQRELVWFFLVRDIRGRYRQMAFGPLWILLQPLITTGLFTLLFGVVAGLTSEGIPYSVFVLGALIGWNFFARCAEASAMSFSGFRGLLSKVYFPRLIVPLIGTGGALFEGACGLVLFAVFAACFGVYPTFGWLIIPVWLCGLWVWGCAIGCWMAPVVGVFRDMSMVLTYGMQALLYLSPVAYSVRALPSNLVWIAEINPLAPWIAGMRWSLLGTGAPELLHVLASGGVGILLLWTGLLVFRRAERTMVDIL